MTPTITIERLMTPAVGTKPILWAIIAGARA